MTAEAIAKVVADIRDGRVRSPGPPWTVENLLDLKPVIDATAIYESITSQEGSTRLYEDHPCIAPPWENAVVAYQNEHGNVIVMLSHVTPSMDEWITAESVDWADVKWKLGTLIFVGGRSKTSGPFPTTGPLHLWQYAIGADGTPLDLHWTHLVPKYPLEHWNTAQLVFLGALNFLNCRNVEIVEPRRSRAEVRRLHRTGVTVHTINVFPVGRSARSTGRGYHSGVPLHPVRGHFANYGEQYGGRGLLFGKYAGRFWIPQYAKGAKEFGEMESDYKLRP